MWKMICLLSAINTANAGFEKDFVNLGGFLCPREERALGRCLRDALNAYIPQLATGGLYHHLRDGSKIDGEKYSKLQTWIQTTLMAWDLTTYRNILDHKAALGLEEYGVPACEPLLIPALSVRQAAGPLAITSTYSDVAVRGPSTMRVTNVTVDFKKQKIVVELFIPELRIKGNYQLSGQVLMLPIEGDGQFSGKYGDIDAVVTVVVGRGERPGAADVLTCETLDVEFHIGRASLQLDNLFGGDGGLGNAMNKLLNENWQKLAEELETPLAEALRELLRPPAARALAMLPADRVLGSARA